MEKIYFASGNPEKVKEAQVILQIPLEFVDLEIDEIQSMDVLYVARRKVEKAFEILGKPVIVDDVSFEIEALNGFPGPFVKQFLATLTNKNILKLLQNEKNRSVLVQSAVAYHDGKDSHVFLGEFSGKLASEEKGEDGWGFDFMVIPQGENKTLAELGFKHKNTISHRALALKKFKEYLDSQLI